MVGTGAGGKIGKNAMSESILVQRYGAIVTVVLSRPEKLNALNKPMWHRLGEVRGELSADDGLRCVVLRGAGGKSFSPGNEISEFETERSTFELAKAFAAVLHVALGAIRDCQHPTIALIVGICVGGGLEIAVLCGIRTCSESSRFGVPIKRLGLVMAYPEIDGLLRLVGRAATLEIPSSPSIALALLRGAFWIVARI